MDSSTPATKAMSSNPSKPISREQSAASAAAAAPPPSALASFAPTNSHSPSSAAARPPPHSVSMPAADDCNLHPSTVSIAEQFAENLASVPHPTNNKRQILTADANDKFRRYFSDKGLERDRGLPAEFQSELGKIVNNQILSKAQITRQLKNYKRDKYGIPVSVAVAASNDKETAPLPQQSSSTLTVTASTQPVNLVESLPHPSSNDNQKSKSFIL